MAEINERLQLRMDQAKVGIHGREVAVILDGKVETGRLTVLLDRSGLSQVSPIPPIFNHSSPYCHIVR